MMIGTDAARAQAPAHLEAVEARHHHVEHDEVEGLLAEARERLAAVGRLHDLVAVLAQRDTTAASGSTARRRRAGCGARGRPCASGPGYAQLPCGFRMLDPRIYRAALVPVLLALIVGAFSLQDRPRPHRHDAGARRLRRRRARRATLDASRRARFPRPPRRATRRRARSPRRVAGAFRAIGRAIRSRTPSLRGRDDRRRAHADDGRRRARSARPGPGSSSSPTATRAAAARAPSCRAPRRCSSSRASSRGGRLRRTITLRLDVAAAAAARRARATSSGASRRARSTRCSCSATSAAATVAQAVRAGVVRRRGSAPLRLRRTVEAAVREEAGTDPGGRARSSQWARLALPGHGRRAGPARRRRPARGAAVGQRRAPAARPTTPSSRDAPARPSAAPRCARSPRSTTRPRSRTRGPSRDARHAAQGRCRRGRSGCSSARCCWPPLLVAVDGFARVRRRREPVGPWLRLARRGAAPFALALRLRAGCSASTGLLPATPPGAGPPPGAIPSGPRGPRGARRRRARARARWAGRAAARAAAPGAAARAGTRRGAGAGAALLVTGRAVAAVLWVVNPYAAALLVPARTSGSSPRRARACACAARRAVALVALGRSRRCAARRLSLAGQLGLGAAGLRLVLRCCSSAGGVVGPLGLGRLEPRRRLRWSPRSLVALRAGAARRRPATPQITVRGPVSYAGPGSLGGTESALRR